jgi:hypothetical protein
MLPIDVLMDVPVQGEEVVQVVSNTTQNQIPHVVATRCGIASDRSGGQFATVLLTDVILALPIKDQPTTISSDVERSVMAAAVFVQQPKHGSIRLDTSISFVYRPDEGFEGEDRFTLQTVYEGRQFTLHYLIDVSPVGDPSWSSEDDCSKPPFVKPSTSRSDLPSSPEVTFSDLLGTALAQTTGTGASAQITLRVNKRVSVIWNFLSKELTICPKHIGNSLPKL